MATLLLRLAAPLQAWGAESKFETRRTLTEPTKSGVIGMMMAALGLKRDAPVPDELRALRMGVRVDQEGKWMNDYQIAQRFQLDECGIRVLEKDGKPLKHDPALPVTHRHYLCDAVFVVGLEGGRAMLDSLAQALGAPAFPLFLGRRSCPPTLPLVLGIREQGLEEALKAEPYRGRGVRPSQYRMVLDAAGTASPARQRDVPLSFNPERRQYGFRAVREQFAAAGAQTEHDAMAELEGVKACT